MAAWWRRRRGGVPTLELPNRADQRRDCRTDLGRQSRPRANDFRELLRQQLDGLRPKCPRFCTARMQTAVFLGVFGQGSNPSPPMI